MSSAHSSSLSSSKATQTLSDLGACSGTATAAQQGFSTDRFTKYDRINQFLNLAGFPHNYHTLNELSTFRREVIRIDDVALHLVWKETPSFEFIKPFPKEFVAADGSLKISLKDLSPELHGFLYSYTRIVVTELDFELAVRDKLLEQPFSTDGWEKWMKFRSSFVNGRSQGDILKKSHARYVYGDLRLNRLNYISWLFDGGRNFYHTRDPMLSFWHGYGKWAILTFAYVTTLLTAMQVGLAGSTYPDWLTMTFKWFSYTVIMLILVQFPFIFLFYIISGIRQVWGWARRKGSATTDRTVDV